MANVTLKTIAEICGVSLITVSKAINGKPDISQSTRERILKVAKESGYIPNQEARILRSGKTLRVAIIYDDFYNPYYQKLINEYYIAFKKRGYSLEFYFASDSINNLSSETVSKLPTNVGGVISFVRANQLMVDYYSNYDIPLIQLDINELSYQIDSFSFDDFHGGELIAEKLLSQGAKTFGYVGCNKGHTPSIKRLEGIKSVLNKHSLDLLKQNIIYLDDNHLTCYEATKLFYKNGVDGFIYFNDMSATNGIQFFISNNIKNFIIGGFDNICQIINFPYKFPSVEGDINSLVTQSSELLIARMEGDKSSSKEILIKVNLF